ncbi:hypothetical protein HGG82_03290 [Marinomonas sp. M1K-6]|uniref:Uncharacterized protein n=1 Tax=Marinomonas profundi TaxID=2726122 RepID=A0A847QWR1_9GAMM|nr:hypothetical protein [Marinomonas profundi]NLQ16649.1 hypothetical protein [Marinomonas profundi]UDV03771.1 hypothetical protein J8N69_03065 [Marinomonas profundi]
MFGIKRMHQQRERLYLRTQVFEKHAKLSREKAIDNLVDKATSPAGLIASFVLGASTQFDITQKISKSLLNGASKEILSFFIAQFMTASSANDAQTAAADSQKSADDSQKTPVTEAPLSSDKNTQESVA